MKPSTRIAGALLALLTVAPTVLSCGNSADTGTTPDTNPNPSTETAAVTEDLNAIKDNLPALDFGGETVNIMHFGLEEMGGNDSSDWNREGDVVADAVGADAALDSENAGAFTFGTFAGISHKTLLLI